MMKKLSIATMLLLAAATASLAQEWNFGGTWVWANTAKFGGNNVTYANTLSYLTLFPNRKSGNAILGRYCFGDSCHDVTAYERPGDSMDFILGGNFFQFYLNRQTQMLEGSFWEKNSNRNDFPDATINMSPLG